MICRLAVESGLRANELRLLKVGSFDFDKCTVIVHDHTAKNRKEKILPLRLKTAAEIKELPASKLPTAQAFKVPGKPIDMLKPDLKAAGIDYLDDAGRYCDFHSLWHTTGSPTMPLGEKANNTHDVVSGFFERAREDSNLQPSDSKSATLSN